MSASIKFLKAEKTGRQFKETDVQQDPMDHIGRQMLELNGC